MTDLRAEGRPYMYSSAFFVLCAISELYLLNITDSSTSGQALVDVICLQCLTFILPSYIYFLTREKHTKHTPDKTTVYFDIKCTLWCGLLLTSLYALLCPVFFSASYEFISNRGLLAALFAYVIFPALGEELAFRYCLWQTFNRLGDINRIIMTSLLFAMIHFDFIRFPMYFFGSLVLSAVIKMTKNIVCTIIIHLLYNATVVLYTPSLCRLLQKTSPEFYYSVFVILFLLACVMSVACTQEYASDVSLREEQPGIVHKNAKESAIILLDAMSTPLFLCCFVIFIIVSILILAA